MENIQNALSPSVFEIIDHSTPKLEKVKDKKIKNSQRRWPADDLDREFLKFVRECVLTDGLVYYNI
jgi:hypothetical protein